MNNEEASQGFLIFPHVRVQNANAISSPLTHGFPSMTAFLGLMWALDRKMAASGIRLVPEKIGVICHDYSEQVQDGYVKTFRLTRNPVDRTGKTGAIVEEGRIHFELTLIFEVWGGEKDDKNNVLFQGDAAQHRALAWQARELLDSMRVAGGSVLPTVAMPGKHTAPQLVAWPEDPEKQAKKFRWLRRAWLPGFALVERDDLLQQRLQSLHKDDANVTLLDAWLDLSRFNYRSYQDGKGAVSWKSDREKGAGWTVPIPLGYAGLSPLYDGGEVLNARDDRTPFRFVETIYSVGQWVSPHRLQSMNDLLWRAETDAEQSLYLCRNGYVAPTAGSSVGAVSV